MESYRGQEEFEEQLLREVKTFVTKNFKEAQLRQKEELDDTFDKIFFRTLKTHRLLVEISDITGIKGENVEIIARSILRFAYRVQNNDVQNIGKQNSRLRSWLRQAQQKNLTHDTTLNAEIDSELKHQSKTSKNKEKSKKKKNEKCKWKAYKVIQTNYYQDVARNNFTFEFGKTARFGNKMVFLAYFKNKEQLEAAIAMDKSILNKWVIHGRRNESMVKIASKEVTVRSLISTSPGKNNKVISINNHGSTSATPNTVINTTTEEVVDTVNKYRKNLLDETKTQVHPSVTPTTKGYTSPENVVKIIEEYRGEIFTEHEIALTQERNLTDLSDKNIKPLSRLDEYRLQYKLNAQKLEVQRKRFQEKPTRKTVTPVKLHEFAKVNADCTERLQKESDHPCQKAYKEGTRSSDSEEDSTIDSSSEVAELQPETKPNTDKINKTPLEGFSRVSKKGRSKIIKKVVD
ncbi:hypothetical protein RhiirA1_464085 [Rhizophagus irregularis]|uniref:Uncharacterized protein n=1 Tax=Rhizophagus irregularis TaxID=588596 RepID=A0A2N0RIR5_9GLOM|nr:hypothetical protein RhiirA1_464085 [Rhizophagus irregularis]